MGSGWVWLDDYIRLKNDLSTHFPSYACPEPALLPVPKPEGGRLKSDFHLAGVPRACEANLYVENEKWFQEIGDTLAVVTQLLRLAFGFSISQGQELICNFTFQNLVSPSHVHFQTLVLVHPSQKKTGDL